MCIEIYLPPDEIEFVQREIYLEFSYSIAFGSASDVIRFSE